MKRDFTKLLDINKEECQQLMERSKELKALKKQGTEYKPLRDRYLAMIFEKASTRTRISFEVGIRDLGGHPIILTKGETQLGRGEPVEDTARVLSRYVDAIMIRTYAQDTVDRLAKWSTVPVINGLTDEYHPCQILSDLFTIWEIKKDLRNLKIVYIGDGNNMANSWIEAAILLNLNFAMATPEGYEPLSHLINQAKNNGNFQFFNDPFEAAKDADVINTDVWVSMGQEEEQVERKKAFKSYRIDEKLLKVAKKDAIVMHCLPAHRGEEIEGDVFERFSHVIFTQAENRLHVQKALLEWLILRRF
ncbi:MAG TPA: ornithine carbamoyltransferase [Syntrophorhabdaceae bacterium]|nr:ornithine carbamoyltransferase [Syntrophorhabdaceae bacterium]